MVYEIRSFYRKKNVRLDRLKSTTPVPIRNPLKSNKIKFQKQNVLMSTARTRVHKYRLQKKKKNPLYSLQQA